MGLYRRKDSPVWWYSFSWQGVRFRASTETESRAEAEEIFLEEKKKARNGQKKKRWKWKQVAGAYWEEHAQHQNNAPTVEGQLDRLSDSLKPETFVQTLKNADFMPHISRRRAEVSNATVNREIELARAALNYAKNMHDVEIPEIKWGILILKEPPIRERYLVEQEYDDLIEAADRDLAEVIMWAVATGMRKHNIKTLSWQQVDFERQVLRTIGKGNKGLTIELSEHALSIIRPRRERTGMVFNWVNFEKRWKKARQDAGVDNLRFHDLRHTFGSYADSGGASLKSIQKAMGHASIETTMRYVHSIDKSGPTVADTVANSSLLSRKVSRSAARNLQAIEKKKEN